MKKLPLLSLVILMLLSACAGAAGQAAVVATPDATPSAPADLPAAAASPTIASTPTANTAAATAPAVTITNAASPTLSASPTITFTPTPEGMVQRPAGTVIVPILLFHKISDQGGGRYIIHIDSFQKMINLLKDEGYQTVTVSQLADVIRSGGLLPEKPVVITFDDGYIETYQNAFPIMRKAGYTATAYIITGTLGTKLSYGYMQDDELKELAAAGWEIGSHSVTHNPLNKTKLGLGNELEQSKKTLEDQLGIKVRSFSYPFGYATKDIQQQTEKAGYDSAVGLDTLITHSPDQVLYLNRREVYRSLTLGGFKKLLQPGERDNIFATQTAAAK